MIDENELIIRPAEDRDGIEACRLLKKLGLQLPDSEKAILAHWNRLWKENPYYNQFDEPIQYGWVMEHEEKIVGFFGSIPRIYLWNSKPMAVSIASQWGVEKNYRAFTGLLCDRYFKNNSCSLKLVTTAIKPTGRIFERYGGKKVPDATLGSVYMVPISLFKLLGTKFKNPLLKSFLLFLDNWFPWKFQYKSIKKNNRIIPFQSDSPPEDLNLFFKEYHARTKGLVAARTSEIIKWHGLSRDNSSRKEYFIYTENNQIKGYASISSGSIPENPDILRFKIIDVIAESKAIKKSVLKELIRHSYRNSADIVEIHHPGFIDKKEIPLPIILRRKHPHFPLYYQVSKAVFDEELQDKVNWNISPFDGDTSL